MYPICFLFVRYRMLDKRKSKTLLDKCLGCNFCGDICDNGFSWIEDAKFLWDVSTRHRKSMLRMHNFDKKHPHIIKTVGCRCIIYKRSILTTHKMQDVDAI